MIKINFPFSEELKTIFRSIDPKKEDKIRIVGGCVRDFISKKSLIFDQDFANKNSLKLNIAEASNPIEDLNYYNISDIDLACKYEPSEIIKILKNHNIKVINTGIKYGTVTALINDKKFEITTLRSDIGDNGRKPELVKFIDSFFEDAKRRDFTINAMSINYDGILFDYFDGIKDLKKNQVKFIGNAKKRIKEDYLRILRFFRFCCRYGSIIDQDTLSDIIELKANLKIISSERIKSELLRIIDSDNREYLLNILNIMQNNDIIFELLNFNNFDLNILKNLFQFEHKYKEKSSQILTFGALIYSQKNNWKKISQHLKFSNKEKKYIRAILDLSNILRINIKKVDLVKVIDIYGKDIVLDALKISICVNKDNINDFCEVSNFVKEIKIPKFIINGNDLLKINIKPLLIGKTLEELKNIWIEDNFQITKEELLEKAHLIEFN